MFTFGSKFDTSQIKRFYTQTTWATQCITSLFLAQNIENRVDTYEGVGPVELRLRRTVGSFGAVEVTWQALPREADSDDFSPMAGKVTFGDGQTEAVIVINVVDDDTPEDLQVGDDCK